MKERGLGSQFWLWITIGGVVIAVLGTIILTNITLRSVEKNLPNKLLEELLDLALVLEDLRETEFAAQMTKSNPSPENFARLRTQVQMVYQGVVELREGYVFDNLINASDFHAVVAPAITDLEVWLSEGVSGYGPETATTAEISWLRISTAFKKASALNHESQITAQKKLNEQRQRLDRFLGSVNLLFMLTLVVTSIMIFLFIRQHWLRQREEQARQEMEHQRDLLNSLFENVLLGITVWGPEGALLHANKGFSEITGYSMADIRNLTDWFSRAYPDPEYRKQVFEDWNRSKGMVHLVREFRVRCGNAEIKDIEFRGSSLPDGRTLVSMADITERKTAEKDKERLQIQLQHAQKMEAIGTLASGVAHDFNNILQAITGNIQLILGKKNLNPAIEKHALEVDVAVHRASDLVQQLMTSSRKVEPKLKPLDISREIKLAMGMLERIIPKMICIELAVPSDLPMIFADASQFGQVVLNLAANARDAMPAGGRLVIEAGKVSIDADFCKRHLGAKPGKYVKISVSDNGLGMDGETLKNVFNPFFTTKDIGKGTGLGLTVVYGIVKNHGGFIICNSAPGQGATFMIYWPISPAGQPVSEPVLAPEESTFPGHELILVVDDEKAVLEAARELLEIRGYRVIQASSGEQALEIYQGKKNKIDLVIMDLGMPGLGGLQAMVRMIRMNPQAKVVIASGYSSDAHVKETQAAGAAGFVPKPYKINKLTKTIRMVLDDEQKGG